MDITGYIERIVEKYDTRSEYIRINTPIERKSVMIRELKRFYTTHLNMAPPDENIETTSFIRCAFPQKCIHFAGITTSVSDTNLMNSILKAFDVIVNVFLDIDGILGDCLNNSVAQFVTGFGYDDIYVYFNDLDRAVDVAFTTQLETKSKLNARGRGMTTAGFTSTTSNGRDNDFFRSSMLCTKRCELVKLFLHEMIHFIGRDRIPDALNTALKSSTSNYLNTPIAGTKIMKPIHEAMTELLSVIFHSIFMAIENVGDHRNLPAIKSEYDRIIAEEKLYSIDLSARYINFFHPHSTCGELINIFKNGSTNNFINCTTLNYVVTRDILFENLANIQHYDDLVDAFSDKNMAIYFGKICSIHILPNMDFKYLKNEVRNLPVNDTMLIHNMTREPNPYTIYLNATYLPHYVARYRLISQNNCDTTQNPIEAVDVKEILINYFGVNKYQFMGNPNLSAYFKFPSCFLDINGPDEWRPEQYQKSTLREIYDSIDVTRLLFTPKNMIGGGIDYYRKYLKYKQKYMAVRRRRPFATHKKL